MSNDDEFDDLERLVAQEAKEDAEVLNRAKAEAKARGKEPFDLDRLEELYDTSSDLAPANATPQPHEERRRIWEYKYYVNARDIITLAEFASWQRRLDPYR